MEGKKFQLLSQETIQKILGLGDEIIPLEPGEMARHLTVTFYPEEGQIISGRVKDFGDKLKQALIKLGVNIIPYEEALVSIPLISVVWGYAKALFNNFRVAVNRLLRIQDSKHHITLKILSQIRKGRKIKKGIRVIALGEGLTGNLPMDNVLSFTHSTVVTILDMPEGIDKETDFYVHFDTAFKLFAYHMTNIVIGVGEKKWILYNFNASHPIYPLDKDFERHLLYSLIPKIAAPIRPPRLASFVLKRGVLDVDDDEHAPFVKDLIESGPILEKTGLYPAGKSVHELAFRNEFYEWVGRVHLDHRSGMSFGFLARQLPVKLPQVLTFAEARRKFGAEITENKDFFQSGDSFFVVIRTGRGKLCVEVPEVWVLTQRSGANKTRINPHKDIIKMGLSKGKKILETPQGLKLLSYFKPSFDTEVILAHAVGNAIFAAVLNFFNPNSTFASTLENNGMAISHWHGYINPKFIPKGWYVYGQNRPPVSCSSSQSAIYAFQGKEKAFQESLAGDAEFLGDIHIEPQHGTNITYPSLQELGKFLNSNRDISVLGNKYLKHYTSLQDKSF